MHFYPGIQEKETLSNIFKASRHLQKVLINGNPIVSSGDQDIQDMPLDIVISTPVSLQDFKNEVIDTKPKLIDLK